MSPQRINLTITEEYAGERLDKALSLLLPDYSRSACAALCEDGSVLVNGKEAGKKQLVSVYDEVEVMLPDPIPCEAIPQDIPLDIVYMDDQIAVVNKPRGMVVHPAAGNPDGTLVNALLHVCGSELSGINGVMRPGIVHRIDKNTSGLLVIAKTDVAHQSLAEQFHQHSIDRVYHAIVCGYPGEQGTVNAPIGRSTKDRKKMAVTEKNSKSAVTHFQTIERLGKYTYVECRLETGRTHQIRVHMSHIGHPLLGDVTYGETKDPLRLNGQCLHAKVLGFTHPTTHKHLFFESDLPEYFNLVLTKLKNSV
jgi:23S rRNA pseudouridine1911/1915/1917 synthase